jgi:uncharacterized protein
MATEIGDRTRFDELDADLSNTPDELIKNASARPDREQILGELLLYCASVEDLSSIRRLVEDERIPIDFAQEGTGLTALHIAVGYDYLPVARLLVDHGARFIPDKEGRMPTTIAAECEVSDEMCDFIAEAEAKAEGV